MQFISHKDNSVYSGDKADYRDIEATSERPSPYHDPVIENGEHAGWAEDTAAATEAHRKQLQSQLAAIDSRYNSDRSWREYVIAHPDGFAPDAVARMQAAEDEAQPLRDELAAL